MTDSHNLMWQEILRNDRKHLVLAVLFGSRSWRSNKTPGPGSDYDLFLVIDNNSAPARVIDSIASRVESRTRSRCDIVWFTEDGWSKGVTEGYLVPFMAYLQNKGAFLHGRPGPLRDAWAIDARRGPSKDNLRDAARHEWQLYEYRLVQAAIALRATSNHLAWLDFHGAGGLDFETLANVIAERGTPDQREVGIRLTEIVNAGKGGARVNPLDLAGIAGLVGARVAHIDQST